MKRYRNLLYAACAFLLAADFARADADLMVALAVKETPLLVLVKDLGPQDYKASQHRTVTLSSGRTVLKVWNNIPDLKVEQAFLFPFPMTSTAMSLPLTAKLSPGDSNQKNDEFSCNLEAGQPADLSAFDIKLSGPVSGSVRLTAVVKNVGKLAYPKAAGRIAHFNVPELQVVLAVAVPDLAQNQAYTIDAGLFPVKNLPPQLMATLKIDGRGKNPANDILTKTLTTPAEKADLMVASLQASLDGKKIVVVVKNQGPTAYSAAQKRTLIAKTGVESFKAVAVPDLAVGKSDLFEFAPTKPSARVNVVASLSPGDPNAGNDSLTKSIVLVVPPVALKNYELVVVAKGSNGKPIPGATAAIYQGKIGVKQEKTDAAGSCTANLPAGTYSVEMHLAGYKTGVQQVTLGKNDRVEIALTPIVQPPKNYALVVMAKGSNGKPIPGATVSIYQGKIGIKQVKTDAAGSCTATLPPGTYSVDTRLVGYKPSLQQFTLGKNDRLEVALAPNVQQPKNYELVVMAKDSDGRPIPGATVSIYQGRTGIKQEKTDATGSYAANLVAGTYSIDVRLPGYRPSLQQFALARDDRVEVALAPIVQPPKDYELVVVAKDGDGRPIPGATVSIYQGTTGIKQEKTDETGSYAANLVAGTYSIDVRLPGYRPSLQQFALARNDRVEVALAPIVEPPKTYELVVMARSSDGRPIPGATVSIYQGTTGIKQEKTDATGSYAANLVAGTYSIDVRLPGYQPSLQQFALARNDRVAVALSRIVVTPKTYQLYIVSRGGDGRPVPNVVVTITNDAGVMQVTTDYNGAYTAKLPPGNYLIRANQPGYTSNAQQFALAGNQSVQIVLTPIAVPRPGNNNERPNPAVARRSFNITIAVVNSYRQAMPNTVFTITNDVGVMQVKTDEAGSYYGKLAPGSYIIGCNVAGYQRASRSITVSNDATVQIVLAPLVQARPNEPVWAPPTSQTVPGYNR